MPDPSSAHRTLLLTLDGELRASETAPAWIRALALAHGIESDRRDAFDALALDLNDPVRRPAALAAVAWAKGKLRDRAGLRGSLGTGPLADAAAEGLSPRWPLLVSERMPPEGDPSIVLAAAPTGAGAKKVGAVCAWLGDVSRVRSEGFEPLIAPVVRLLRHSSERVREHAHSTLFDVMLRTWSPGPLCAAIVRSLLESDADLELVVLAADFGEAQAVAHLAARASANKASSIDRMRAAWHRADAAGMREVIERAKLRDQLRLIGFAHDLEAWWQRVRPPQPLFDALVPFAAHEDPQARLGVIDTLANLAGRGANAGAAIDAAARGLGDAATRECLPPVSNWRSNKIGRSSAWLLGHAIAQGNAVAEERALTASRARKAAIRKDAQFALGLGLSRGGRWDVLAAHLRTATAEARDATVAGVVAYDLLGPEDEARLVRIVDILRRMGEEPLTMAALRGWPLPPPTQLSAVGLAELIVGLGTSERSGAVRTLSDAVRAGSTLGVALSPLAGVLLCGDYVDPYPYLVLETLAMAARRGEDASLAAPFLDALLADSRIDVRAAAAELVARASGPIDSASLMLLAERPFTVTDPVEASLALRAARHAAEALAAHARHA